VSAGAARRRAARRSPRVALRVASVLLALGALAPLAGCRVEPEERREAEVRAQKTGWRGILAEDAGPKPEFVLTDTEGRPFDFRKETDGKATLLFFGYTHCPDVCPVHLANIAAVMRDLPLDAQKRIEVVFVTADPARDTPEVIRSWLDNFDRRFVGLRGDQATVDSVMTGLGLPPAVLDEPGPEGDYSVGHASQVIAFAPDGSLRIVYPFGTRQTDWAHDLPKLARIGS
jgi:protein SCO1